MSLHGTRSSGREGFPTAEPLLAVSYEGRPAALLTALADTVGALEITPDCLVRPGQAQPHPELLAPIDATFANLPVTYHGIGLSIGTAEGWNDDYLRLLDEMCEWRMPLLHSEHFGYTTVDGSFLGAMPAMPTTAESAELIIDRGRRLRQHLGIPCLLEHVASPLPHRTDMTLAAWLNLVCHESGCGLLLDLHNLECDADNGFIDIGQFLSEIDTTLVGEIHLAAGVWHEGLHLDVHSGLTTPTTLNMLAALVPACPNLQVVTYEILAAAVPVVGVDAIVTHLGDIAAILNERRYATC